MEEQYEKRLTRNTNWTWDIRKQKSIQNKSIKIQTILRKDKKLEPDCQIVVKEHILEKLISAGVKWKRRARSGSNPKSSRVKKVS